MEGQSFNMGAERPYPVLFIPRACTVLEANCEMSENVFIYLNITSPDTAGNPTCIYSGYCNLSIVESADINIQYGTPNSQSNTDNNPTILTEANQITFPTDNEAVWMDPARSPYVYNHCTSPLKQTYAVHQTNSNHITVEHNTYITQNVYNYNQDVHYSPVVEEQIAVHRVPQENAQNVENYTLYEEDELECGVFLSQLSEEIIHEKETKARDNKKFIGLKTDNEALKQLMSTNIQSMSKQQKTILFLGHDSKSGQTIQNISIDDPMLECMDAGEVESEVIIEDTKIAYPTPKKKYQCDKCKQIFDQLSTFKQHMVGYHRHSNVIEDPGSLKFMCTECGKSLKNQEKFELHCQGHGDPDLECNMCHKVFASKFTLKNHKKIHTRKYPCTYCTKSYATADELYKHSSKFHHIFKCEYCPFICNKLSDLDTHQNIHRKFPKESSVSDFSESLFEEILDDDEASNSPTLDFDEERTRSADLVIAKVVSNNIFSTNKNKSKRLNKTCEVCMKSFDRIGDLKRHLIEHVIRSTLSKNPVNKYGVLNIRCEICQEKIFSRIDRYKAHLREHAKLTLYKCTFCDKSFSDSSNFSKHKKIHGTTYFQCDKCLRKFNSKKMLIQHMEYHNKHGPVTCQFCDKVFHLESMLSKHVKCCHLRQTASKFRCRFCRDFFKSLKEKWDHEWDVHHVRKVIMDCLMCGSRFRKYTELKRHCIEIHNITVPRANRLLRWKLKKKMKEKDEDWAVPGVE